MSLRARLAVVLAVVMIGPVLVCAVVLGLVLPRSAATAAAAAQARAAAAAGAVLVARCRTVADAAAVAAGPVTDLAAGPGGPAAAAAAGRLDAALHQVAADRPGVALAVLDGRGRLLAAAGVPRAAAAAAAPALRAGSCTLRVAAAAGGVPVLAESVPVDAAGSAAPVTVLAWLPLDDAALRALRAELATGADLLLLGPAGDRPPAAGSRRAGLDEVLDRVAAGHTAGRAGGLRFAVRDASAGLPYRLLVVAPEPGRRLLPLLALLAAGATLAAALLVRALAARLTGPLAELARTADRIGAGELGARSGIRGRDEVGRLAAALDTMATRIEAFVEELASSSQAVSEVFDRFGQALGRTHDLDGLLEAVVTAAINGSDAVAGLALLIEPRDPDDAEPGAVTWRERIRALAPGRPDATAVAEALAGYLAGPDGGTAEVLRDLSGAGPVIVLPLRSGDAPIGLLALARGAGADPFDPIALARARALAGHAGVAIANVRQHEENRRLSVTDPLTGVGNRRQLTGTLSREVERATRFARPLTVLMLDLDHFKQVNDTLGHAVGDGVLREVAHRLLGCLREVDTVARYGGEEFAVLLPETDLDGGARVAQRVLAAVREEPFRCGGRRTAVTVSIGVATFPAHGRTAAEVLRSADGALYTAKANGRDGFAVAPLDVPETSSGQIVTAPAPAPRAG